MTNCRPSDVPVRHPGYASSKTIFVSRNIVTRALIPVNIPKIESIWCMLQVGTCCSPWVLSRRFVRERLSEVHFFFDGDVQATTAFLICNEDRTRPFASPMCAPTSQNSDPARGARWPLCVDKTQDRHPHPDSTSLATFARTPSKHVTARLVDLVDQHRRLKALWPRVCLECSQQDSVKGIGLQV